MPYFDPTVLQSSGSSHLKACSVVSILILFCFYSPLCCYSLSGLFYFALQKFVTSQLALIRTIRQLAFPFPDKPNACWELSERSLRVPVDAGDMAGLPANEQDNKGCKCLVRVWLPLVGQRCRWLSVWPFKAPRGPQLPEMKDVQARRCWAVAASGLGAAPALPGVRRKHRHAHQLAARNVYNNS